MEFTDPYWDAKLFISGIGFLVMLGLGWYFASLNNDKPTLGDVLVNTATLPLWFYCGFLWLVW